MLERTERITVDLKNVELQEALTACFKNQPLSYTIIETTIVVKPKEDESQKEKLPPSPIDIKGRVINENSEPVLASVMVKGTSIGTTTNIDGYFELKNVDENAILIVTGIGIEKTEVKVNGRADIIISANTR